MRVTTIRFLALCAVLLTPLPAMAEMQYQLTNGRLAFASIFSSEFGPQSDNEADSNFDSNLLDSVLGPPSASAAASNQYSFTNAGFSGTTSTSAFFGGQQPDYAVGQANVTVIFAVTDPQELVLEIDENSSLSTTTFTLKRNATTIYSVDHSLAEVVDHSHQYSWLAEPGDVYTLTFGSLSSHQGIGDARYATTQVSVLPVPEPSSFVLLGTAAILPVLRRLRCRRRS